MKRAPLPSGFRAYVPFLVYFLVLLALMPKARKFEYEYKSGSPWKYDSLVSEFDFPIYKTDEQMMRELADAELSAIPYFKFSESVAAKNLRAAESISLGAGDSIRPVLISALRRIYSQGIIPDDFSKADRRLALSEDLIYIQRGKRATKYPNTDVYRLSQARTMLIGSLQRAFPDAPLDSALTASGLFDLIEPNLIFDRQMTELVHRDEQHEIAPTQGYVPAGSLIVSEGEIVTAEVSQMLDSYKREYDANMGSDKPSLLIWLSQIALALILTLILFWVIYFADSSVFSRRGELYYLVFIALLAVISVMVLLRLEFVNVIYLVPFTLSALYLQAFFPNRTVAPIFAAVLLPIAVFLPQGVANFVIYLLAGYVAIRMFGRFNRGWKQFLTALAIFGILALGYLALRVSGLLTGVTTRDLIYIFIGSILNVAFYQLIFVFEKLFGLLSVARLEELTDTNNKLLRALELKAPGTFQHSLQVMSMADAAARAIGANVYLIRAGAMYHDIGKMNNPQCFIENEALLSATEDGARYHTGLSPRQSAADITRHVTDGLELARKERLPGPIIRFIETHHGDNLVRSFYNKYLNEGGDPAFEKDFRYEGSKPVSKEEVIMMLCDSVEAASRTLKEHSAKSFSDFVEGIVGAKVSEGQLEEADITIKELNTVKEVLKSYLAQIYHERVAYPKRNNESQ